jgi:hypothetical protein
MDTVFDRHSGFNRNFYVSNCGLQLKQGQVPGFKNQTVVGNRIMFFLALA